MSKLKKKKNMKILVIFVKKMFVHTRNLKLLLIALLQIINSILKNDKFTRKKHLFLTKKHNFLEGQINAAKVDSLYAALASVRYLNMYVLPFLTHSTVRVRARARAGR